MIPRQSRYRTGVCGRWLQRRPPPAQSARSALAGGILDARLAGSSVAAVVTAPSRSVAPTSVTGSCVADGVRDDTTQTYAGQDQRESGEPGHNAGRISPI